MATFRAPEAVARAAERGEHEKDRFCRNLRAIAQTPSGDHVLRVIMGASGVWAEKAASGQSMEHFMGRRSLGLFILKHLEE